MKETGILFTGDMIQAVLDGRKTMTRRVAKNQSNGGIYRRPDGLYTYTQCGGVAVGLPFSCPYGQPGDSLYVKETWQTGSNLDKYNATEIKAKAQEAGYSTGPDSFNVHYPPCPLWYPIDGTYRSWGDDDIASFGNPGRKRSPRFMPRWAARIILQITEVRVERLQSVTNEDAQREGTPHAYPHRHGPDGIIKDGENPDPYGLAHETGWADCWVCAFTELWDSINKERGFSWVVNPYVWVISFKRIGSINNECHQ